MAPEERRLKACILVSACLLGEPVRYDGSHAMVVSPTLNALLRKRKVISFCPEVEGGCPIPRPPAEIIGGDGHSVLDGKAKVLEINGRDTTMEYLKGAQKTLHLAQSTDVKIAILKEDSPSCGSHRIYDGSFSIRLKAGMGVTAALLERNAIHVFGEEQIQEAAEFLQAMDDS
jgi:uncharacterized protein YbbK (DUF523 family)